MAVFVGGAAGTALRAVLAEEITRDPGSWPWPTFLVNVAGALLLGWLVSRNGRRPAAPGRRRALLELGFCGGFTTFAAMQLELLHFLDSGQFGLAIGYATASIVAGLAAVFVGSALGRRAGVPTT